MNKLHQEEGSTAKAPGPTTADPLSPLPDDVQLDVLRRIQWSARSACKLFRARCDADRTELHLRWPPSVEPRQGGARKAATSARRSLPEELQALLARQPKLTHLDAAACPSAYITLVTLPSLTSLSLHNSPIDTVPASLAQCPALTSLDLSRCRGVSDLRPLASSCRGLQSLSLSDCRDVESLVPLASCIALRSLSLHNCNLVKSIAPLSACTGLVSLDLSGCLTVNDVAPLAACLGLQMLNLCWTSVVDLGPLAAACPQLRPLRNGAQIWRIFGFDAEEEGEGGGGGRRLDREGGTGGAGVQVEVASGGLFC